jgi:DNA polymerase III subunit epsilon
MLTNETETTPAESTTGGYEHLARRAHLYMEQNGGRAREEVLVQVVFGVRGKPDVWGAILTRVLSDPQRFRRLPGGEWCLNNQTDASHPLKTLEYVVIDTETTGLHPQRNRLIEIAAIRIKDGQRVETYQTLINPYRRIPGFISKFTGINNEMTSTAPGFGKIADKLLEFFGQRILVGHNIPFDLRFIDYELRRLGRPALLNETIDTITLATRLHPGLRRPNLDRLAAMLDLPAQNRHRAFGDASITADALLLLLEKAAKSGYSTLSDLRAGRSRLTKAPELLPLPEEEVPPAATQPTLFELDVPTPTPGERAPEGVSYEIARPERVQLKKYWYRDPNQSLTNRATAHARDVLSRKHLENIPHKPGVYLMKDVSAKVIYVGKAKDLRDRVSSYYSEPLGYTRKMDGLVEAIDRIDHIVTGSELEALLLESKLIKQYKPRYNRQLRNYENYPFIKIDLSQRFPRIYSVREIADDGGRYFGPFKNRLAVDATIEVIEQLFPIRTCSRSFEPPEPGKKKRYTSPCLRLSMHRCPGPCVKGQDGDSEHAAYLQIIDEVISFLNGEKETMLDMLWARLNRAVRDMNFEKAAVLRDAVAQVEKIVTSQQFLAAAVEGNNTLICLPSVESGCAEVLCVYRGRLGRQLRVRLNDENFDAATLLSQTWAELAAEEIRLAEEQPGWGKHGGRVIGQEAVDEINIISRWLYAHRSNQAIVPVPPVADPQFWQSVCHTLRNRSQAIQ